MKNENANNATINHKDIPKGWQPVVLGDFTNTKHGYAFKGKNIVKEPMRDILVTPGNFRIGGGFKNSKFKYFNGEYPKSYILKENDIIVTMTDLSKDGDTLGYSAKVPKSNNEEKYLHNQRIGLVEFLNDKIDKDFIYWLLRTKDYHGFIVGAATGTSIRHTSPTTIKEYEFFLPPLPEQKAIASMLSCLDDKIDLLHLQNKTLEDMAETIFRQWFVPARAGEPHAGGEEAQEDWGEGKLGEVIGISSGKGLKKKEYVENGSYPVLGANGEIGRTDKCLFDEKLIFTGRVGTLGKIFISTGKVWLSDNTLIIKPKEDYFYFVYFLLKNVKLEEYNVGSTQPLIRQSDIKEIEILLPKKEQLYNFEAEADLFFKKMQNNQLQIRILEQLRDALLPNLMSGEVRMKV